MSIANNEIKDWAQAHGIRVNTIEGEIVDIRLKNWSKNGLTIHS